MSGEFHTLMQRYVEDMPESWAGRWDIMPAQPSDLLTLIEDVTQAVANETLTYQQAGFVLRPLIRHPVSEAWPNGELTALGLHAASLTAGPQLMSRREAEYEWGEVVPCLQRAKSTQLPA